MTGRHRISQTVPLLGVSIGPRPPIGHILIGRQDSQPTGSIDPRAIVHIADQLSPKVHLDSSGHEICTRGEIHNGVLVRCPVASNAISISIGHSSADCLSVMLAVNVEISVLYVSVIIRVTYSDTIPSSLVLHISGDLPPHFH